ncbi:tuberous sclerosis 1 protein hamartin isoform X2 [Lasioglossum baleicum]|uniref:tuberous sclerosis 1 protein hamartin isoform X2 n=1 Tax=Lasioglossum baleicum TaxID=434251 RepID=UPI003FCE79C0
MNINTISSTDLFCLLESNKLGEVEEIKKVFHELFLSTKDNWLVNGLFDYYLSTNSLRAVEVLASVRDPHDKHLLDRLSEALSRQGNSSQRIQTLTLLGHIARRQPTWLYKLASHALFRDLLKLLKLEADTLSLMSALLLLVMLLPMLPAALGPYLSEIFEVFGRLASYYHHQSLSLFSSPMHFTSTAAGTIDKNHLYLLHLQVGLYSLFHRLYAMYPCNFISYLKQQYIQRDQLTTFTHTIRPMLDSVRMHPLLVTASKDAEISAARWKKMEHHDIMAECGRFTLDKCREEVFNTVNSRSTPPPDHSSTCTPINTSSGGLPPLEVTNGEDETFWSPSMTVPPQSPPFPATSHEQRSAPSTPNNNRSGTSPPEAAVEATPETTPVKDVRKLSTRQVPVSSAAVRALTTFGNGTVGLNSRPSTPTSSSTIGTGDGNNAHGFISHKISKIIADRQAVKEQQKPSVNAEEDGRFAEIDTNQNGKNDSWQEDQEVLEIVSSQAAGKLECPKYVDRQQHHNEKIQNTLVVDLTERIYQLRLYSQYQIPAQYSSTNSICKVRKSKSCPNIEVEKQINNDKADKLKPIRAKRMEETGTQTQFDVLPYEYLLLGILDEKNQMNIQKRNQQNTENRLSPTAMLDRYVEACTRANNISGTVAIKQRQRKENDGEDEVGDEDGLDAECTSQLLQLMQIQLQFERQRREVHAERNRRLLGKLRDSRALEEHNYALTDRLKLMEKEVEGLKGELESNKQEALQAEERYKEALHHWQTKCVEEERQNQTLKDRLESIEVELKDEQKKILACEQRIRSTDASLFDAGHRLRVALKAADRSNELERTLDTVQKKYLLLGEAQAKLQETTGGLSPLSKQEATQIQRSYTEELTSLRRQLETRTSLGEALKVRLSEMESKDARKEAHLVELQRLLQETKDQHEAELEAVESKYKAQAEINLLLESRILELHGTLEPATSSTTTMNNLASSASPKERSPPLSASLASSSEGSLAFIHSGTGIIMNDCCDTAGEIPNLQAIVEPVPNQAMSPSRQS